METKLAAVIVGAVALIIGLVLIGAGLTPTAAQTGCLRFGGGTCSPGSGHPILILLGGVVIFAGFGIGRTVWNKE